MSMVEQVREENKFLRARVVELENAIRAHIDHNDEVATTLAELGVPSVPVGSYPTLENLRSVLNGGDCNDCKELVSEVVAERTEKNPEFPGMVENAEQRLVKERSLQETIVLLLKVMEIQEKRMTGEFHLSAEAFTPMWDQAKAAARDVLAKHGG